jgi:hypothetical protein
LNNGNRQREIGYHDLERAEDEEALQGGATEHATRRDGTVVSRSDTHRQRSGEREPRLERITHLTERERRARWPIG